MSDEFSLSILHDLVPHMEPRLLGYGFIEGVDAEVEHYDLRYPAMTRFFLRVAGGRGVQTEIIRLRQYADKTMMAFPVFKVDNLLLGAIMDFSKVMWGPRRGAAAEIWGPFASQDQALDFLSSRYEASRPKRIEP